MSRILALDLSLTRTGCAEVEPDEPIATFKLETKLVGEPRLAWLRDMIIERAKKADVVVCEGYSFASHTAAYSLGELGGVVRLALFESGTPYMNIAPAKLKAYACGTGRAGKEQVLSAASHRAKREFPNNDEADAWWLAQLGMAHYCPEHPAFVVMPTAHQKALRGIEWPDTNQRSVAV